MLLRNCTMSCVNKFNTTKVFYGFFKKGREKSTYYISSPHLYWKYHISIEKAFGNPLIIHRLHTLLVNSYYTVHQYSSFWINTVIDFSSVYTGSSFEGLSWGSESSSKAGLSILLALEYKALLPPFYYGFEGSILTGHHNIIILFFFYHYHLYF